MASGRECRLGRARGSRERSPSPNLAAARASESRLPNMAVEGRLTKKKMIDTASLFKQRRSSIGLGAGSRSAQAGERALKVAPGARRRRLSALPRARRLPVAPPGRRLVA